MDRPRQALTIHCEGPLAAELQPWTGAPVRAGEDHVHFATIAELRDRATDFMQLLDPVEQERHARFRFEVDQERFLLAHGLLRHLLGRYLDTDPAQLRFGRGAHGKPFLQGHPLHFNLSDTKDAIAIAVGTRPLGIDLETTARTVDHVAVGQHYFTADEQNDIAQATDGKRRFLELWTRKEAVLKASGVGIMDDLKLLQVNHAVNTLHIGHEAFIALASPAYHLHTWSVGDGHLLSLASAERVEVVHLLRTAL
jgi:4'-phosphopantetheinyl transferase